MSVLAPDTADSDGRTLSLETYWIISNRYRTLKRKQMLDAATTDDLAYEARFLERFAECASIRASASQLLVEIRADVHAAASTAKP